MSKILITTLILFFSIGYSQEDKSDIAVLELEGNNIPAGDLGGLSNRLRTELFNTGKFNVIERSRMDEILKEQGFQQTGCTNAECAVEIGQLIGVKKIIIGSVDKVGNIYTVDIRMVDVKTGKIEKTATVDCENCEIGDVLKESIHNSARILADLQLREHKGREKINKNVYKAKRELIKRIFYVNANFIININSFEKSKFNFNTKTNIGPSINLGFKKGRNNFCFNISTAFFGSEGYTNKNDDKYKAFGGAGFVWLFDILDIKHIFLISPGISAGLWVLDAGSGQTGDSFLIGGPKLRFLLGKSHVYFTGEYTFLIGNSLDSHIDLGLLFMFN